MKDQAESNYKDDPKEFAQSSDLATRGATGEYAGGGVDDSSANFTPAKGEQTWQKGKPEDTDEHADKPVESRSDDPGQSSYGGFKNDGPATDDGHAKP